MNIRIKYNCCHFRSSLFFALLMGLVLLFVSVHAAEVEQQQQQQQSKPFQAIKRQESASKLFEPPPQIKVLAPSHFPPPTLKIGEEVQVLLEPVFGQHRPDHDAVFAYAEGYKLSYYMMFLETLTATGFRGDVVLAIAEDHVVSHDVKEYLESFAQGDADKPSVVVYQIPLYCEGTEDHKRKYVPKVGGLDGFQMCQMGSDVYGYKDELGHVTHTAPDPRGGRTVATIRYEWYWIASLEYNKHSWIMLLDARDSFFQTNPFVDVPRELDPDRPDGILYLFGENANATRLGISRKNRNWLTKGYGEQVIQVLKNFPTICSGSSMGEQVAIETYLRAMVNEHDECEVKMMGSDQGFHNYLYYSQKLGQASTIRRIVVWEQGRGMINNLGALRVKPLEEWGNYDPVTHQVYQWDGETLSPVVHQFDRDNALHKYMVRQKHGQWEKEWRTKNKK